MPRYYFHQHVLGQKSEDPRGKLFPTDTAACRWAAEQMPTHLRRAAEHSRNIYLATEVTKGDRTLFVVRGTIVVERR